MNAEPAKIEARTAPALLEWYARHRRELPWRARQGKADPYAVWLSEIMLQQTNVTTVKPYYTAFLARWPTVGALAAAPIDEVMKAWAGLGYYARARNLHACAVAVVERHGGCFPQTEADLRTLPGIGAYTAAAIAAIAFGRRAVVVDGNVERVVTRLFTIDTPLPAAKPQIRAAADRLTPSAECGDFAQAMMDLGATICTPTQPACVLCPLTAICQARATNTQPNYPVKMPKPVRPSRQGDVFYIRRADGHILVRTRETRGLLGGMTEIPGTQWSAAAKKTGDDGDIDLRPPLPMSLHRLPGTVEHVFTHFALSLRVHVGDAPPQSAAPPGFRFVSPSALDAEALPSLMRKVVAHARAFDISPSHADLKPAQRPVRQTPKRRKGNVSV